MKIFLLIHEQDTDAACGSDVKPFTDKRAALDAMRKGWEKTVSAWAYASGEHDGEDEYECECRGDTAIIRSGGDVEYWRIEEHDLAVSVSVAVEVSGGLVQCVYAKGGDVDADVFDLDASDSTDEGEQDEARAIHVYVWDISNGVHTSAHIVEEHVDISDRSALKALLDELTKKYQIPYRKSDRPEIKGNS